jgi:hypothetical protein
MLTAAGETRRFRTLFLSDIHLVMGPCAKGPLAATAAADL